MDGWIPSVQMDQRGLLGPASVFSDQPIFSAGLRSEANGSAGSCCWGKKEKRSSLLGVNAAVGYLCPQTTTSVQGGWTGGGPR